MRQCDTANTIAYPQLPPGGAAVEAPDFPEAVRAFALILAEDDRAGYFDLAAGAPAFRICCRREGGLGGEAFSLRPRAWGVEVSAAAWRGAFYALLEILEQMRPDGSLALSPCESAPDFPLRSISAEILLDAESYNGDYAKYLVRRLAKGRINAFHIGFMEHLLSFRHIEGLPDGMRRQTDEGQLRNIRELIDYAGIFGISCYVHYRVFSLPARILELYPEIAGDGTAFCPSSPKLWEIFEQALRELPALLPRCKGLVLLLSEGTGNFFECGCSRCAGAHESEYVRRAQAAAARALGPAYEVVVRTYLSGWRNIYEEPW
ncbi:MAG: hypothetical protein LBJ10_11520, partial [Clostridiales bacterium]|nr:hypothetical protein [Clostridiales bacterium]